LASSCSRTPPPRRQGCTRSSSCSARVSGGHFNPVVSLADASFGGIGWRDALAYIPAQVAGCVLGAIVANGMFSLAAISISTHHRASPAHLFSEVIATAGLLLVIFSLARTKRANTIPAAVGAYIGAAYFFTSSASFANPAITVGRMFSNTFAGIAPASVPGYVIAQLIGCLAIARAEAVLYPDVTAGRGRRDPHAALPPGGHRLMASVLFVCLHNAGRSQMSQALFERAADGRHTALSAGTTPAEHVHPEVIEVMRELGIDLFGRRPQLCSPASSPSRPMWS
jgi:arsenate reductase